MKTVIILIALIITLTSCNTDNLSNNIVESLLVEYNRNVDKLNLIDKDEYIQDSIRSRVLFDILLKQKIDTIGFIIGDSIRFSRILFNNKEYRYLKYTGKYIPFPFILIGEYNNGEVKELYFSAEDNTFQGDTLMDVNNDSSLDYIRKWYPSSGCCLANNEDIYMLYNKKIINIINPTYFNKREVVSMSYDRPGESILYHFLILNTTIDTLSVLTKDTNNMFLLKTKENQKIVNELPYPYCNIKEEYLNWFLGN